MNFSALLLRVVFLVLMTLNRCEKPSENSSNANERQENSIASPEQAQDKNTAPQLSERENADIIPTVPQSLQAILTSEGVQLYWAGDQQAKFYYIYRSDIANGEYQKIGMSQIASYLDRNIIAQQTYNYAIQSVNSSGMSELSKEIKVVAVLPVSEIEKVLKDHHQPATQPTSLKPTTIPQKVSGLKASANGLSVMLTWEQQEKTEIVYQIWRSEEENGVEQLIGSSFQNFYHHLNVTAGRHYYYRIRAQNSAGDGESSDAVKIFVHSGRQICVTNNASDLVTIFDGEQNGNVEPIRKFGSFHHMRSPWGIAIDQKNQEIFVTDSESNAIYVYPLTSFLGNIEPKRIISGKKTLLNQPFGIALSDDDIIVANYNTHSINIYSKNDQGDVAPRRRIEGSEPDLSHPAGIAISNDEIIVANVLSKYITVYPLNFDAKNDPKMIKSKRKINATADYPPYGVTISNDEIYIASNSKKAIVTYPLNWKDSDTVVNFMPKKILKSKDLKYPADVQIYGKEIIVTNATTHELLFFDNAMNSQTAAVPLRRIVGAATQLNYPVGLKLLDNSELLVVSRTGQSIQKFPLHWEQDNLTAKKIDMPPLAIIAHQSGIKKPTHIVMDNDNKKLIIANITPNISFYDTQANGPDVQPQSVIQGKKTLLDNPYGMFISQQQLWVANYDTDQILQFQIPVIEKDTMPSHMIGMLDNQDWLQPTDVKIYLDKIYVSHYNHFISVHDMSGKTLMMVKDSISRPMALLIAQQKLFVANLGKNSVLVYALDDKGMMSSTPERIISGKLTELSAPGGIAIDEQKQEIFVTNTSSHSVVVFPLTGKGNIPPLRKISGVLTQMKKPWGITLCQ